MVEYPFNGPIILTDTLYTSYGGWTGTSTALQRSNAYWMAEIQVSFHIGTLLLPTNVTGTFPVPRFGYPVITDWGEVTALNSVLVYSKNSWYTCDLTSNSGCGYIRDNTYGYVDPACAMQCACGCSSPTKFKSPIPVGSLQDFDAAEHDASIDMGSGFEFERHDFSDQFGGWGR